MGIWGNRMGLIELFFRRGGTFMFGRCDELNGSCSVGSVT